MAYQERGRSPLFDSETRARLERSGRQFIGLALIGIGLCCTLVLWSFSPEDPGWLSATSGPAENLLGRPGATIASLLHATFGQAGWGFVPIFLAWGGRFLVGAGGDRVMMRSMFSPFAVAFLSIYMATHVPPARWDDAFGLGGLLGDAALEFILDILAIGNPFGVRMTALASILVAIGAFAYAMGVDRREAGNVIGWLFRPATGVSRFLFGSSNMSDDKSFREKLPEIYGALPEVRSERPGLVGITGRIMNPVRVRAAAHVKGARREPSLRRTVPLAPVMQQDDPAPGVVGRERRDAMGVDASASASQRSGMRGYGGGDRSVVAFGYAPPPVDLLVDPTSIERPFISDDALERRAGALMSALDEFGIRAEIVSIRPGPVVTIFELEAAPGLKVSRVIVLADDIAASMSSPPARVSILPENGRIAIELPNDIRETCVLREILEHEDFTGGTARLPLAMGRGVAGDPVISDLAKMPHLLIAGAIGSGKSATIRTMIMSLLYSRSPEECRMILIDPARSELGIFDGTPHLLSPVIMDPVKAVAALNWTVSEMEDRYRKMSKTGVRDIESYNSRVREALEKGERFERTIQTGFDDETGEPVFEAEEMAPELLPLLVVIVDEMENLMTTSGRDVEVCIQRLTQMARASGIHLVMATRRPEADVITETIKASFPTRIAFRVTSKADSRTILGKQGAEQLIGQGDMLFMTSESSISRIHGPFCSLDEIGSVVEHLKAFGAQGEDMIGIEVEGGVACVDGVLTSPADATRSISAS